MLPDLAKLKDEIFNFQQKIMHLFVQQTAGPFAECKRVPLFEGHRHGIQRSSGVEEIHDFMPAEGEIIFKPYEDDLDITFSKLFNTAVQISQNFQKKALERLDTSLTKAGQSIDATGMSAFDGIFEMFEKIEFPLGKDGRLDMSGYTFIGGSEAYKRAVEAFIEIDSDPVKTTKIEDLFKRKEEEARAREANRKLVG